MFVKKMENRNWPPDVNPFKRPMNAMQKQWYRVLLARRVGLGGPRADDDEPLSYDQVCRRRYAESFRRYNRQFRREIMLHETMQPSALHAMRFHRTFAITTLWPPLHSRREINMTLNQLEKVLSVKERRRLQEIIKYEGRVKYF